MAKMVIVKYRDQYPDDAKVSECWGCGSSYTAKECGVTKNVYDSVADAEEMQRDLLIMQSFNPTVYYGFIEVGDSEE